MAHQRSGSTIEVYHRSSTYLKSVRQEQPPVAAFVHGRDEDSLRVLPRPRLQRRCDGLWLHIVTRTAGTGGCDQHQLQKMITIIHNILYTCVSVPVRMQHNSVGSEGPVIHIYMRGIPGIRFQEYRMYSSRLCASCVTTTQPKLKNTSKK